MTVFQVFPYKNEEREEFKKNGLVDFHLNNPFAGPSTSHDMWMKEKVDAGWVYGEIKDPEKKTHPCIVPYDKLPVGQQSKDYIFREIVHCLKPFIK